jgi:protein phosphatase
MSKGFRVVARSHVGVIRSGNEDAGLASTRVIAVADGMGGHAAGEIASSAVIHTLQNSIQHLPTKSTELEQWFTENVNEAHSHVGDLIVEDPNRRGMGTTLSILIACEDAVVFGHIGDSRIYRLRERTLEQITTDHTYVQTLVDSGEITNEEAAVHPRRNLLMRAIDGVHDVSIDVKSIEVEIGDRFLVCSDGLTGVVSNELIAEVLYKSDLTYAVSTLIENALAAGAPDNVTVVVGEYVNEPAQIEEFLVGSAEAEPALEISINSNHKQKVWPWILGSLSLIVVGMLTFGFWLTSQWYIGTNQDYVVVYQGINQNIGPLQLSQEVFRTSFPVSELSEIDRINVVSGITQPDLKTAQLVLREIADRSPYCLANPTRCI